MSDALRNGCHVERISPGDPDPHARTEVLLFGIDGMGCTNCANRIHNALVRLAGVVDVDVALAWRAARVEYDPERTGPAVLVQAIEEAGRTSGHRYAAAPLPAGGLVAPSAGR